MTNDELIQQHRDAFQRINRAFITASVMGAIGWVLFWAMVVRWIVRG